MSEFTFKEFLEENGDVNRPVIREDFDGALAELIRRCWVTDPERRPTMRTVVNDLRTMIDGNT